MPPEDPNLEHWNANQPPLRDDTRFAAGKIAVFQYTTVGVFILLISGFWRLQVQSPQFYKGRAEQNRIKSVPIPAPRGRILDRDGRVIVDNRASYALYLAPERIAEEHLGPIAEGLDIEYDGLAKLVRYYKSQKKYSLIPIKGELSRSDLAFVCSHTDYFPELELIEAQRRLYPQDGMMAHVIGYTGQISQEELDQPEFSKSTLGDIVGKTGIEKQYNSVLTGVNGQRQVVVNHLGQFQEDLGHTAYTPGKDIQLTIDLDLQAVADLALEDKVGAVVGLDPRTGEVLVMASRPAFDLNHFAAGIKAAELRALNSNPDRVFLNRAIQAQQAPGSTFKPIVALAALEEHEHQVAAGQPVTAPDLHTLTVACPGYVTLYQHVYHCMTRTGHGMIQLHNALVHSCDSYFYTVGDKLGIDVISKYGGLAGFGQLTGIDLPHENPGLLPSKEWSARVRRARWYAGETPSVAVGQGALTVTPLQLARAIGGMAIGGKWLRPHLLKDLDAGTPVSVGFDPENVREVVDGMYGVVNEGGTGSLARLPNIEVCGKTGTAQVASMDLVKSDKSGRDLRDNAWFVGFAPRQAPEIVIVAFVEHGLHGANEAPIVRDLLKAYFDKKMRTDAARAQHMRAASISVLDNLLKPPAAALNR